MPPLTRARGPAFSPHHAPIPPGTGSPDAPRPSIVPPPPTACAAVVSIVFADPSTPLAPRRSPPPPPPLLSVSPARCLTR